MSSAAASSSKVCAVFGYGPGLGASIAKKFSSEGYKVALCSRTLDKVTEASAQIPNSKGFQCDVTDPDSVEAAITKIRQDFGGAPVHTLVYNAGSGVWDTYDKIDMAKFDMSMKTNVHGLLKATQCVAPDMIAANEGNILITGATASLRGKPFTAGFAPAKGAQRLLAESLARDLWLKGVHVALFIIDAQIGSPGNTEGKLDPDAVASAYYDVSQQPKSCWTFELAVRPSGENW